VSAGAASWAQLSRAAPELAGAGERLLIGADGVAIAFLASAGARAPHLSPVCPIFSAGELFVIAPERTPKARDLRERGAFVLHAFLGANDEEFQLGGRAREVTDAAARARVHGDVRFPSFGREDPIFRLDLERALWVRWEGVGTPDARSVRRVWRAGD
jgi:hypothetical protein